MLCLSITSKILLDHIFSRNEPASVQVLHRPPRLLQTQRPSQPLLILAGFVQDTTTVCPGGVCTWEVRHNTASSQVRKLYQATHDAPLSRLIVRWLIKTQPTKNICYILCKELPCYNPTNINCASGWEKRLAVVTFHIFRGVGHFPTL